MSKLAKWQGLGNLVDELLEEILVRLPVKCLLRLKATRKNWRSLIESPSFTELYRRRHGQDHRNRLVYSRYTVPDYQSAYSLDIDNEQVKSSLLFNFGWAAAMEYKRWPLDFALPDPNDDAHDDASREIPPYSCILGPLDNGIYCSIDSDRQRRKRVSVATSRIVLENLATKEYRYTNPFPHESAALLSDLARRSSQVHYGFGSVRNESGIVVDYKVVVIVLSGGQDYSRFVSFVYSLRRDSWDMIADVKRGDAKEHCNEAVAGLVNGEGKVETPLLVNYDLVGCPQLFVNGSWHWLDVMYDDRVRVLRFDVAKEEFGYIGGPPHDYSNDDSMDGLNVNAGLFVMDDRLAMIYLLHEQNGDGCVGFDVWVMMEYGIRESWTKICSCKAAFGRTFDSVMGVYYSSSATNANYDHRHGITRSGNDIHIRRVLFLDANNGKFVSWDGSKITELDFHLQPDDGLWNTLGVSTYVETLDSLKLPHIIN